MLFKHSEKLDGLVSLAFLELLKKEVVALTGLANTYMGKVGLVYRLFFLVLFHVWRICREDEVRQIMARGDGTASDG